MSLQAVNQSTGATTQIAGLFAASGSIDSISVNGVAQTIVQGAVDLNVAENLITETQWAAVQAAFNS